MTKKKESSGMKGLRLGMGIARRIILVFFLFFNLFESKIEVGLDATIQPTYTTNTDKDSDSNELLCPSGEKVLDWFECSEVQEILNNKLSFEELDCSQEKNYDNSKLQLAFSYGCLYKDNKVYFGAEELCEEMGNTPIPSIRYSAYPSLNEYSLNRFTIELKNNGCTKMNYSSVYLVYNFYQNGVLLATTKSNTIEEQFYLEKQTYELNNLDFEEFLYPSKTEIYWLSFGSNDWIQAKTRDSKNNYSIKVCLVDKSNNYPIDCEIINFHMDYTGWN